MLAATVWLMVGGVGPLVDPEAQLLRQNLDCGSLSTAGWSRQQQDATLKMTTAWPNLNHQLHLKPPETTI